MHERHKGTRTRASLWADCHIAHPSEVTIPPVPLIYTATCPHCGHEAYAHDPTLAIQRDDGSLLHLPHPSESRHLEAAGLTWRQAANQARLIRTTTRLCRSCGQFVKLPNRVPPEGCLGALVGVAGLMLTFLAVALLHDYATAPAFVHVTRSQIASILTLVAPAALVALALWRIIRFVETRTFRANLPLRQPIPQPPCCPRPRLRKLPLLPLRKYPCPTCQNQTLTVRGTGKS